MHEDSTQVKQEVEQASFRCKMCNLVQPADRKAAPWKKGKESVDLHRCVDCARAAARWNSELKADGQQVVALVPRRRRRRR